MRHKRSGFKLKRDVGSRNSLLKGLVTSVIEHERIVTTVPKAKAARPLVERMITLGKSGSVHSRRQALAYLMTPESVDRLFATVAPRYADRNGGYSRIVRTGPRKGDAGEMAFIELLGAEKELNEKAEKRAEAAAKRREALQKQLDEHSAVEDGSDPNAQP